MAFIAKKLISASGATEETDDSFSLVTSLYHFDGSNGAQNNTYVDSSSTSKTLTCSSNLAQGTFSPFSADEGKWSGSFDGTDDYLSLPNHSDFTFGSGNWTVEAFVNVNEVATGGSAAYKCIYSASYGVQFYVIGTYLHLAINDTDNTSGYMIASFSTSGQIASTGVWYHVAAYRDGSNFYCSVDGAVTAMGTSSSTIATPSAQAPSIGIWGNTSLPMNGFISNLRVIKGTALYGSSNFTAPSTPLTAVTNTKLLTCCSNRFYDKSTSAHTVTAVNGAAIQPFSPFAPSAAYDAAVNGGSAYWPTETDKTNKITLSSSADFAFGTGAFTIDCWVYVTADTNPYSRVWHVGPLWNDNNAIGLVVNDTASSDKTAFCVYAAGGRTCVSTNVTPRNEWFHVACVRHATGYFELFINGVSNSSNDAYSTTNISPGGNQTLAIGNIVETNATLEAEACFEGYISNLRVVKGTAVYTSSFTPPTAPTTDVTNTKLLANFTNAAIIDQTGKTNVQTVGNAQLDTSVKKFGTASVEFDGTDDYIEAAPFVISPQRGSWTYECFIYPKTVVDAGGYGCIFDTRTNNPDSDGVSLFYVGTASQKRLECYGPAAGGYYFSTANDSITLDQWQHVALVFDLDATNYPITCYVNGTSVGSSTTNTWYTRDSGRLRIGAQQAGYNEFTGFIDEFRVTNKARYTSNFTAPTKEFPNL